VIGTVWVNVAASAEGLGVATREAAEAAGTGAGEGFKEKVKKATETVGPEIGREQGKGFASAFGELTSSAGGALKQNLSTVGQWVGGMFSGVFAKVGAALPAPLQRALGVVQRGAEQVWGAVSSAASKAWGVASQAAAQAATAIKSTLSRAVSTVWDPVATKGKQAWDKVSQVASGTVGKIKSGLAQLGGPWGQVGQKAGAAFGVIGKAASALGGKLKSIFAKAKSDSDSEAGKTPNAWQRALAKIGEFGRQAGQQLKDALGNVATGAAAALTGALGLALKGGFDRLVTVENASAQMRGLGMASEQVASVMADVKAAVQDTQFSTGEMAQAASQALVAGIKPGEQLNAYMTSLKNTAAAAGAPLSEIQMVFGQIQSAGRATTQDLLQLSSRGIPAFDLLAKSMGVTTAELKDLVSEGKVAPEQVFAALGDSLALMAGEMANTTRGALTNAKSALSRFGEALIQGEFPAVKTAALLFRELMNAAIALVGPIKEAFGLGGESSLNSTLEGMIPKVQAFTEKIKAGGDSVSGLIEKIRGIGGSLGSVAALATPLLGGTLSKIPMIGGAFKALTGPLGMIISAVGLMLTNSSSLRESLGRVASSLAEAFANPAVTGALQTVADVIGQVAGVAGDTLATVLDAIVPVIVDLVPVLASLVSTILPPMADVISLIFTTLGPLIADLIDKLAPIIMQLIESVVPPLITVFEALVPVITSIVEAITPVIDIIVAVLMPVIEAMAAAVGPIFTSLANIIKSALGVVASVIKTIMAVIKGDWGAAWDGIKSVFSNLGELGKNIVQGIVNGIKAFGGMIKDAIVGVAKAALGGIASFLGIKSPSRVFRDKVGRQIGAGLVQGLNDSLPAITDASLAMAAAAIPKIPGIAPGALSFASQTPTGAGAAGNTIGVLDALQGAKLRLVVDDQEFDAWLDARALDQVKDWSKATRRGAR
jgi:tape measure domain-containing protein